MNTKSKILDKDFDYKVIHIGLFVNDDLWQHDKWTVLINGQTFDYHTGIGHRKINDHNRGGKNWHGYKDEATYYMNANFKQEKKNLEYVNAKIALFSKPVKPNIDDVLYSLIMDSDAKDITFEEWADTFGYDTDSRKAESTYRVCRDNANKVSRFIDDLDQARELFQDY